MDATQTTVEIPETLQEAILHYANPDNCFRLLVALRWPNGVVCPHCDGKDVAFMQSRHIWQCRDTACRKQFSIKVRTIFEDSPVGLDKWLMAMWLLANCKNGVSAYEIHRAIGVTQKTAWFMLHRLRLAMQTGFFTPIQGTIEADEIFVGGKAKNMHNN